MGSEDDEDGEPRGRKRAGARPKINGYAEGGSVRSAVSTWTIWTAAGTSEGDGTVKARSLEIRVRASDGAVRGGRSEGPAAGSGVVDYGLGRDIRKEAWSR